MASLLNQQNCRAYALQISKERRNGKFTRVSESFMGRLDSRVKLFIYEEVKSPSARSVIVNDSDLQFLVITQVQAYAAACGQRHETNGKLSQISLDRLNLRMKQEILGQIETHPSIGCTLK